MAVMVSVTVLVIVDIVVRLGDWMPAPRHRGPSWS